MPRSRYTRYEISVGAFVLLGILALLYLSVSLGGLRLFADDRYDINARFSSVAGLKLGDPVKLAGVNVGEVHSIKLEDYQAVVTFKMDSAVKLPTDTIAGIQSAGLLGDSYVSLSPGANEEELANGESIIRTEAAVSLTDLISKYAFGSPVEDDNGEDGADDPKQDDESEEESPFSNPLE